MPNRLENARSPYLLQHKDNPVDWQPWGDEAFAEARRRDVPVFLSIGYATCHWCHVMEHESFEDDEVAAAMNAAFVSIKVDREERPDIDHLYMSVCQLIGRSCGWPLTVLLTPERLPFFVATYLPKHGRFGRPGMMDLVPRVAGLWQDERDKVTTSATEIAAMVARNESAPAPVEPEPGLFSRAAHQLKSGFDATYGGFGSAPKFPAAHNLLYLLRYSTRNGDEKAIRMVAQTLEAMANGAIFDQVGFGFHRYSTDVEWRLPHFEKMLYDQAWLLRAYTEAWQATGTASFRHTAMQIATYVIRDLQAPNGGFYSAEDADSEGEEGTFYVWSDEELRSLLTEEEFVAVRSRYGVTPAGNFSDEASGERMGVNVLHAGRGLDETASSLDLPVDQVEALLEVARGKLFAHRVTRIRPLRDEKILTDWNGLMIGALAAAGRAFAEPSLVSAAEAAAECVVSELVDEEGTLLHRWFDGEAGIEGLLDDYAMWADGLVDLYQATFDPRWLAEALRRTEEMMVRFGDDTDGAFFFSVGKDAFARPKQFVDGAMPSGMAVTLRTLLRLSHLTGRTDLVERADWLLRSVSGLLSAAPGSMTGMLAGSLYAHGPAREIVVVGRRDAVDTQALLRVISQGYHPHAVTLLYDPDTDPGHLLASFAPFLDSMRPVDGRATAYVCTGFACEQPVTDTESLRRLLETPEA